MLRVGEPRPGLLDPAAALDVDPVGAVDHHLGDRGVAQERLDRPVAEHVVDHLEVEGQPLVAGEPQLGAGQLDLGNLADALEQRLRGGLECLELGADLLDTRLVDRGANRGEAIWQRRAEQRSNPLLEHLGSVVWGFDGAVEESLQGHRYLLASASRR